MWTISVIKLAKVVVRNLHVEGSSPQRSTVIRYLDDRIDSSLYGRFVSGNESAWERNVHNPYKLAYLGQFCCAVFYVCGVRENIFRKKSHKYGNEWQSWE